MLRSECRHTQKKLDLENLKQSGGGRGEEGPTAFIKSLTGYTSPPLELNPKYVCFRCFELLSLMPFGDSCGGSDCSLY